MRLTIAGVAASLLLGAAGAALAQSAPAIDAELLKRHTEILSSDEFEGRAPATPGEQKTVAHLARAMESVGLRPGNGGSWFQEVPLVEVTARPAPLTVSGNGKQLSFSFGTDTVMATARTAPVDVRDSEMVFVGYGVNAPERGWNDYAGVDVRGKTVVILINDPDWRTVGNQGPFEGRAMTYYGRWTYKYEEAARQGAAAALIIHDTEPAAYGWNVVESSWTGPQLYMDDGKEGADTVPILGWVTQDSAKRIFAAAGQDMAALVEAAKKPGFKAVPLGLRASARLETSVRRSKSRNVVGIIPGKSRPNEYVLYTAHWDHLGRCKADASGDDICNGAVDNASGTAGLLALADAFRKGGAPERSVVFLAVTAEESGLLGSAYYAANPIYLLGQTVGGINMDGLNIVGPTEDVVVVGGGKSELERLLERAVARQRRKIEPEPSPEKGYYYRSDHFSLAKLGVPMLYAESGVDVRGRGRAWGQAQAEDYTASRYHQPSDEYDPSWNWDGAVEDLQLYYMIGRELADGTAWPNWYPTAEFRAARDRSRGGAASQP